MVKLLLDRGAKIDAKTRVRVQLMYLLTLVFRKQVCFYEYLCCWLSPGFVLSFVVVS